MYGTWPPTSKLPYWIKFFQWESGHVAYQNRAELSQKSIAAIKFGKSLVVPNVSTQKTATTGNVAGGAQLSDVLNELFLLNIDKPVKNNKSFELSMLTGPLTHYLFFPFVSKT